MGAARQLGIGDAVWVFVNRRAKDWRECWEPWYVAGETKVSWLIVPEYMAGCSPEELYKRARRMKKRDVLAGTLPGDIVLSKHEIDERVWVLEHRFWIGEHIERDNTLGYEALRKVATLIGYDETERRKRVERMKEGGR